ncbi:MAG: hypothetical protein ABIJ09_12400 [Pseudomonadota bacterium]
MTASIHPATARDQAPISTFLIRHFPDLDHATIAQLFTQRWSTDEGCCGYRMVDEGRIVGFIGHIYSRRPVDGVVHKFCSLSTWAVDPAFRAQSSLLLFPLFRLAAQGYTITDFTAAPHVRPLWGRLGFAPLDTSRVLMPVLPGLARRRREGAGVFVDDGRMVRSLTPAQQQLHRDHVGLEGHHVLARTRRGDCYAVFTIDPGLRGLATATFHHIASGELFLSCVDVIKRALHRALAVRMLDVPSRFVAGLELPPLSLVRWDRQGVFLSRGLRADQIDGLYSELVLLRAPPRSGSRQVGASLGCDRDS